MNTNEFIQKPVRQLFFHYLIPAICGTMVTSIYVLADTIFIGKRLGATALAALNISCRSTISFSDWDFYPVSAALY